MLTKTEAVTLKSMKYRDTSKIVTFYTKEYGKIKGIAKGARSGKNKYGSALEPFTHSMLLIYKKEHRDLHLISQCDAIVPNKNISNDLSRMSNALAVLELVNQTTHNEERNPPLFTLLIETLDALNSSEKDHAKYLDAFRLRLAALFGYKPDFDNCGKCGAPILLGDAEKEVIFQIARGAVFCNRCYAQNVSLMRPIEQNNAFLSFSAPALQIARRLLSAPFSSLGNFEYDSQAGNKIDEFIRFYLRYHFDGLKPLKSIEILQ